MSHGEALPAPTGRYYNFIGRRAGWVLAATALLAAFALSQLFDMHAGWRPRVGIDPSLDPLVAPDDPGRKFYDQVRHRFGNDESVLVVLEAADIYRPEVLRRLYRLTEALRDLDGVAGASSLTTAPLPTLSQGAIDFARLEPQQLDDPALPARLRAAVDNNPLLRGNLVSADGRAAAILVTLDTQSDREILALDLAGKITGVADAEASPEVKVRVTGASIIRSATSNSVTRQLRWVVPAIVVLLALFLGITFRSWAGVLLPLATISIALCFTLATLAMLGHSLNLITSLVPPLLVTMGLAYCAHILCEHQSLGDAGPLDAPARIALLLSEVTGPVLLTGFTTAIGLLALAFNPLPAITEFAWLSALGVFYTMLLVLTFLPAMLRFLPAAPAHEGGGERLFERVGRRLGEFDVRRRKLILVCAALMFGGAVACSTLIRVGDQFVGIFPKHARVRADFEAVNGLLGGVNPLAIVIDGPTDIFTEPYVLRSLDDLEHWLLAQPEVGTVTTLADHVKVLSANLAHAQSGAIPASRDLVRQLLFFGDGELLRGVVNSQRSSTLVSLRLKVDDTADISAFVERLQPELAKLPVGLTPTVTGNTMLVTDSVAGATSGQIQSVAFALLVIYLCLALQFASWTVGLLATLPTALQTAIYFGALGISGVTLNATTSLVECLVLGLAVDDTIHYLARFNSIARRSGSEQNAAVAALSAVLRPVTLTKVILALGFLMLITGDLRNQVLFGWLAALTLATAWLVDVFVTPAFISGVRVVTLWDSLRLNLGRDVQTTIPLFAGLSTRQARVFALMSQIVEVPPGTRLMTEGESAGEMEKGDPRGDVYVVIAGELGVWIERAGQRRDLTTLGRGAVVGETGYFGQRRMANVDTLTRARLLRFDDADQEVIMRRYPKIAARVFLNLNRIQAARRAENAQVAVTAHG